VIGAPPPPAPSPAPSAPVLSSVPVASTAPGVTPHRPVDRVAPTAPAGDSMSPGATAAGPVPAQEAPVPAGPTMIRLIFTDGSVVLLREGSLEGRRAQYLARRVLEAAQRS
jgi:predicted secreted protein